MVEAKLLFIKNDIVKAEQNALSILPHLQKTEFAEGKQNTLYVLAQIYFNHKDFDKAIYYAEKIINDKEISIEQKLDPLEILSKIYIEQNKFDKAIAYRDSLITYKDLIYKNKNSKLFETNKIKFKIIKKIYLQVRKN